ncbi:RES family NAD+ phosphorylase [Stenotrophomonas rhizophila]|uniref:RES family NAD+ phosphorylase n=1 Tax=Stenotrophomonas rhizophila TaxID=216778 RepID=UPI0011A374A1|nr:RES domain-containing protein [Stenotrophomonas rhizophila]
MRLARIGSTGPTWAPDDMTGAGAATSPGRWNREGERVIYAAPSLAMAVLETAAHIDDSGLPLNKYVIEIDVPDEVWAARLIVSVHTLPVGWDAIPHGMVSIDTGSNWYAGGAHAIIELPSAIVPEETIVLINAQHADSRRMRAQATRRLQYNLLFRER